MTTLSGLRICDEKYNLYTYKNILFIILFVII